MTWFSEKSDIEAVLIREEEKIGQVTSIWKTYVCQALGWMVGKQQWMRQTRPNPENLSSEEREAMGLSQRMVGM